MKRLIVFLSFISVLTAQQMFPPNPMNGMNGNQQIPNYPPNGYPQMQQNGFQQPMQSMQSMQQMPMNVQMQPPMQPAVTTTEVVDKHDCEHGACCSSTKTFLPSGEPCRATTNPCEEIARCNGNSAECPENPKKTNGSTCMLHGQCTDGYCTEYECVGLCCTDGVPAAENTPCGPANEGGKCLAGTCTVYRQVDPHVTPLTEEEKEIITEARKEVKGEIEGLLRSHAKYLIRKVQFEEKTKRNALENIENTIGTNVTGTVSDLKSSLSSNSSFSWSSIILIVGLCLVAVAFVIIFVVKPKERIAKRQASSLSHRAPKKRTKEDMSSADYDPPAF